MARRYNGSIEDQDNAFLQYLEEHSLFACRQFLCYDGVRQRNEQWPRVTDILNALGPHKTSTQWMAHWTELRRRAREYNAQKRTLFRRTGNDNGDIFHYNLKYERILKIMGKSHNNGLELIPEIGIPPINLNPDANIEIIQEPVQDVLQIEPPIEHATNFHEDDEVFYRHTLINLLQEISTNIKKLRK